MLKIIKSLLLSTDKMVLSIFVLVTKLEKNIYYIKLTKMFSVCYNFCSKIISVFINLFSYIAINLKTISKILKIGVMFIFIYRLVILLFGYDYILAHHQIELDLLTDFIKYISSEFNHYKDHSLQWLINQLNSFISSDINSNISPTTSPTISPTIESPIIESNINQPSLRADYKDTMLSTDSHNAFYHSPYFYIIIITSISLLGYYYFNHPLWLDYNNLNNQDIDTLFGDTDLEALFNNSSTDSPSSDYSDYFKSPVSSPSSSYSPTISDIEGSPTPKQMRLILPN
jgi:hypothetical protein